jgi:hypothetical protein
LAPFFFRGVVFLAIVAPPRCLRGPGGDPDSAAPAGATGF